MDDNDTEMQEYIHMYMYIFINTYIYTYIRLKKCSCLPHVYTFIQLLKCLIAQFDVTLCNHAFKFVWITKLLSDVVYLEGKSESLSMLENYLCMKSCN